MAVLIFAALLGFSVWAIHAKGRRAKDIQVAATLLGGLAAFSIALTAGKSVLNGSVGHPGGPYFKTGKLVPVSHQGSPVIFRLRYQEWRWWGMAAAGDWPVRWTEEEGYEYYKSEWWHAVPIFSGEHDGRSFSADNRGWHEDR